MNRKASAATIPDRTNRKKRKTSRSKDLRMSGDYTGEDRFLDRPESEMSLKGSK